MEGLSPWQLCYDENTGYNYYWNVETNEVKWEITGSDPLQTNYYDQTSNQNLSTTVDSNQLSENQYVVSTSVTNDKPVNNHNGITLITSYGYNSDEDDDSDNDKDLRKCHENSTTKKVDDSSSSVVYGPFLPPSESTSKIHGETYGPHLPSDYSASCLTKNSVLKNEPTVSNKISSLVPYGDVEEDDSTMISDNQRDSVHVKNADREQSSVDGNSVTDDETDSDADDEDALLSRLREKAMYLKKLGGVVPDELKSIVDETKTVEDIIAEIENELPPDHVDRRTSSTDDAPNRINNNKQNQIDETFNATTDANRNSSSAISLIADYGNESEPENEKNFDEEKPSKKVTSNQQSAVNTNSKLSKKIKSTNLKVIKLSSRAKELIKTSMLTAKARQTNFVQTEDGLKPAEEVSVTVESNQNAESGDIIDHQKSSKNNKKPELLDATSLAASDSIMVKNVSLKETISNDKTKLSTSSSSSSSSKKKPLFAAFADDVQNSVNVGKTSADYTSLWAMDNNQVFSLVTSASHSTDRKGFGFLDESVEIDATTPVVDSIVGSKYNIRFVKSETINVNDIESSVVKDHNLNKKTMATTLLANVVESPADIVEFDELSKRKIDSPAAVNYANDEGNSSDSDMVIDDDNLSDFEDEPIRRESITSKDDSVKSKNVVTAKEATADIDITDIILNGNVSETSADVKVVESSQLIMEKLRYLNTGGGIISPVQIMAIQIETLMGAWHAKAIDLKYLEEWLEASCQQLRSIEDTVVPEGWHCEWDRSFRRYYYRNVNTGAVQWNFPDSIITTEKREFSHDEKRHILQPWMEQESIDVANDVSMNFTMPVAPPAPNISTVDELVPPPAPVISDLKRSLTIDNKSNKKLKTESSAVSELSAENSLPLPVESPPETPPPPPPLPSIACIQSSSVLDTIPPPLPPIPPPPPVIQPPLPPCSPPPSPSVSQLSIMHTFPSLVSSPSLSTPPPPPPPLPVDPPPPSQTCVPPPPPPPETPPPISPTRNIVPPLPPTPIVQTPPPPPPPLTTQTPPPPPEIIVQNPPLMILQHAVTIAVHNPPLPPTPVLPHSSHHKPLIHSNPPLPSVTSVPSNYVISSASVLYDKQPNCNPDKDNSSSTTCASKENTDGDKDELNKPVHSCDNEQKTSSNLISALDSFYSDIASLNDDQLMQQVQTDANALIVENESLPEDSKTPDSTESSTKVVSKKKKKMKFDAGLSLKKKGLEGLVAKWQKVNSSLN